MPISIKITPQWCRRLGWAGVALVWAGVLLPWEGSGAYAGSFLEHFPVTAVGVSLVAGWCGLFFHRRSPYPALGLLVVLIGWGAPMLGQFYFGRYTVLSWIIYGSPFAAPGGKLFDFGFFLMGAGALGLLHVKAGTGKNASEPQVPEAAGAAAGLVGQWRLAAIGQSPQPFPAQIVMGIMNQTWRFQSDGKLEVRTFGWRRHFFYTADRQSLVTRNARGALSGRWIVAHCAASEVELRHADRPTVCYRLERK